MNRRKLTAILAAALLLAAAVLLALLWPRETAAEPEATAPVVVTARPTAALPTPTPTPATPEPVITPPADQPGDAASASDVQLWVQLPATDSDLEP